MATLPAPPNPLAPPKSRRSTFTSSLRRATARAAKPTRCSRRPASTSRPSVDLPGRSVALSIDVPALFDAPLEAHHRLIGRWAAKHADPARRYTRNSARQFIERTFDEAVRAILEPFDLASLRIIALAGADDLPPAIAVICDTIGQLELGWIEKTNCLRDTMFCNVAPLGWRAAAYRALCETLGAALPVFGYEDLFEEVSSYYWDGATDDVSARATLIEYHGAEAEDLDEMVLPSQMNARRPDWMTAKSAPLKDMPADLRRALARLRDAHKALKALATAGNAWRLDFDLVTSYVPEFEDCSHLPSMTLVPFEQFARELDDVGRHGMEQGFMDVAGLCQLTDATVIDSWFASLKLGAELLFAAQALINLYSPQAVKVRVRV